MSSENIFLALRLEGPLQSYGFDSQYNRRITGLMPTKSAVAGICCAAFGYARGSEKEKSFLTEFATVLMTSIQIPFSKNGNKKVVRRFQDYHTVQNTLTAEGKVKDCHITYRQYLTDTSFGIILQGDSEFMSRIANALVDPVWGIWLGRKTCIPSAPVFAGLADTWESALSLFVGDFESEGLLMQQDAALFSEGRDSIPDNAVSFDSGKRSFAPRRVR